MESVVIEAPSPPSDAEIEALLNGLESLQKTKFFVKLFEKPKPKPIPVPVPKKEEPKKEELLKKPSSVKDSEKRLFPNYER